MRTLTRLAAAPLALLVGAAVLQGAPAPQGRTTPEPPRIIELREAESPFIAFNIWIRSGSVSDPKGKEGLASLTAALMSDGATRRPRGTGRVKCSAQARTRSRRSRARALRSGPRRSARCRATW